jgi:hypothetical protein
LQLTVHWPFVRASFPLGPPLYGWLRVQQQLALQQLLSQRVLVLVQRQPALELRRAVEQPFLQQLRACDWK